MFDFSGIYFSGFILGIFLIIVLWRQSDLKAHLQVLLALLILSCLIQLDNYLMISGNYRFFPHFTFFSGPLWYLVAPIIYVYFQSLRKKPSLFIWPWGLLHLVPAIYIAYLYSGFYLLGADMKIQIMAASMNQASFFSLPLIIFYLQNLFYIIWIGINYYTSKERPKIFLPLYGIYIFILLLDVSSVLVAVLGLTQTPLFKRLAVTAYVGMNYLFVYQSMSIPGFLGKRYTSKGKYASSKLDTDQIQEWAQAAQDIIREKELYLQKSFKMDELANLLNINKVQLSEAINKGLAMNFNDLVNRFRIEKSLSLLKENYLQKYDMSAIAEMCGYNNTVSFYRNFKKVMGQTPKEYLSQQDMESQTNVS